MLQFNLQPSHVKQAVQAILAKNVKLYLLLKPNLTQKERNAVNRLADATDGSRAHEFWKKLARAPRPRSRARGASSVIKSISVLVSAPPIKIEIKGERKSSGRDQQPMHRRRKARMSISKPRLRNARSRKRLHEPKQAPKMMREYISAIPPRRMMKFAPSSRGNQSVAS